MVLLFCFRSGKYILELSGVAPLLIIIIGAALRCFVPIDIPVFTRVIQHEGWLAKLDAGLRTPIIYGHITPLAIIFGCLDYWYSDCFFYHDLVLSHPYG